MLNAQNRVMQSSSQIRRKDLQSNQGYSSSRFIDMEGGESGTLKLGAIGKVDIYV